MIKTTLLALTVLYMPFSYKDARNRAIDDGTLYSQKYNHNGKCYANMYLFKSLNIYPADIFVISMTGGIAGGISESRTFIKVFTQDHRLVANTGWMEPGIGTRESTEWDSNTYIRYSDNMGYQGIELKREDCGD